MADDSLARLTSTRRERFITRGLTIVMMFVIAGYLQAIYNRQQPSDIEMRQRALEREMATQREDNLRTRKAMQLFAGFLMEDADPVKRAELKKFSDDMETP